MRKAQEKHIVIAFTIVFVGKTIYINSRKMKNYQSKEKQYAQVRSVAGIYKIKVYRIYEFEYYYKIKKREAKITPSMGMNGGGHA